MMLPSSIIVILTSTGNSQTMVMEAGRALMSDHMINLKQYEVWFVTGSQHLYGPENLEQVAANSKDIARVLNASAHIPTRMVFKPILTTPDAIYQVCKEANLAANCVGLIAWMHTFSPAKMWIRGLRILKKPLLHLHT